jgi:hypothetical protein
MKHFIQYCLILLLLICSNIVWSQTQVDSVLIQRNAAYNDYRKTVDSLKAPTRLNLSILHGKAGKIIELDNTIINYYLYTEIESNKKLSDKTEQLSFEISLMQKEAEVNIQMAEESKFISRTLLYVTGAVGLLFIIVLIFFIDRQIRIRSMKLELQHTWPLREAIQKDGQAQNEIRELYKRIDQLNSTNKVLTVQLEDIRKKMKEKDDILSHEMTSKKQIEEEIRNLISQIKSQ